MVKSIHMQNNTMVLFSSWKTSERVNVSDDAKLNFLGSVSMRSIYAHLRFNSCTLKEWVESVLSFSMMEVIIVSTIPAIILGINY